MFCLLTCLQFLSVERDGWANKMKNGQSLTRLTDITRNGEHHPRRNTTQLIKHHLESKIDRTSSQLPLINLLATRRNSIRPTNDSTKVFARVFARV